MTHGPRGGATPWASRENIFIPNPSWESAGPHEARPRAHRSQKNLFMTSKSIRTLTGAQSEAGHSETREAAKAQTKATTDKSQEEATERPEDASDGMAQQEAWEAHSEAREAKTEGTDNGRPQGEAAKAKIEADSEKVHCHEAQAWRPTTLGVYVSGVGVTCWGPDEQHFTFLPDDPVEGRCQKYRLPGVGQQMEDGTFVFQPGAALPQRAQSVLICQLPHGRLSLTRDHAIQLTLKMRLSQHSVPDIARFIMQESGEAWEELTLWHQSREREAEGTSIRPLGDDSPRTHEASPTQSREPRKSTAGDCEVEGWQAQPVIIVRREEPLKGDGPEATPQAGSTTLVGLASEGAWKGSSTPRPS